MVERPRVGRVLHGEALDDGHAEGGQLAEVPAGAGATGRQRLPGVLTRLRVVSRQALAEPVVAHDVREQLVEGAEPAPVGGDLPLFVYEPPYALLRLLDPLEVLAEGFAASRMRIAVADVAMSLPCCRA